MPTIDLASAPTPQKMERAKKEDGLAVVRVNHLLKLFRSRHPDGLPDDGNGRDALYGLVALAIHLTKQRTAKLAEIYRLAPWASEDERDDLERQALVDLWWPTPDALGGKYKVTRAERHGLEVWQLGAIDESREERKANEREKHRERSRESRRRKRTDSVANGAKPSTRDRENRLLEELSLGPVKIPVLAERVRHLPEFKGLKDLVGSLHKLADALKARGLIVDNLEPVEGRAWKVRTVRKATERDRRAEIATAAPAAPPVLAALSDNAAEYFERLEAKLKTVIKEEDTPALGAWFTSRAERAVRARYGLTPEQLTRAHAMINGRLREISGRKVFFAWSRPS